MLLLLIAESPYIMLKVTLNNIDMCVQYKLAIQTYTQTHYWAHWIQVWLGLLSGKYFILGSTSTFQLYVFISSLFFLFCIVECSLCNDIYGRTTFHGCALYIFCPITKNLKKIFEFCFFGIVFLHIGVPNIAYKCYIEQGLEHGNPPLSQIS